MKVGSSKLGVCLLVLILMFAGFIKPGEGHGCTTPFFSALVQLISCRAAVAPSSPFPPNEACCNAIRTLGQPCLCLLVTGPPIMGVDRNLAVQLPGKCSVNYEPCEVGK